MTELRFARPGDAPTIMRFIRELAEFERSLDKVVATEALLHEALFGPHPGAEVVIAERDGVPLGMALFFHNFSTWTGWRGLYLEDLYVAPEARGLGIGGALLRHLAKIAVDRGCTRLEWSVLDWNIKAIDFYRAMGAEPMDEWTVNRVSGAVLTKLAGQA